MEKIKIVIGNSVLKAELFNNNTAKEIHNALPLKGKATLWGKKVYFPISLDIEMEDDAREELEVGELAYWQPGKMFCIFYGRTPISTNHKPRAASEVNVFGRITGDISPLYAVKSHETIIVEIDKNTE
jgi:hypothetical protein